MWIGLEDAWLSVVKNLNDDETLLVRARKLKHLTNVFPDCDYFKDSEADYPYRAFIPRHEVADGISSRLATIEYPNFKAAVQDVKLHNLYTTIWREAWYAYMDER